jgi:NitT/TauT family transport system permease protein
MFVLGKRDFRLPGLGSYLQTAANAADTRAIVFGLIVMIGVIVAMDQLIWRPVIAWAEKFKFEQVEGAETQRSAVLDLLRRSRVLPLMGRLFIGPASERLGLRFARAWVHRPEDHQPSGFARWVSYAIGIAGSLAIAS